MPRGEVIAVDAMSGDHAPKSVIGGLVRSLRIQPEIRYILHGDAQLLERLLRRRKNLRAQVEIVHAPDLIAMNAKAAQAIRQGRNSSMWHALDSVGTGKADVAISAGNTGALMAMSFMRLRQPELKIRPAIAALWPTVTPNKHAIVLDMGADIRADEETLVNFAIMGAEYSRAALNIETPNIAILNVGSEENKGREDLRIAAAQLRHVATHPQANFNFIGFVEGSDISSGKADVIVTDGFSGNIALKTAEGTAKLITSLMHDAFQHSWLTKLGAVFAYPALKQLKRSIDPRRVNGGVLLGLDGVVVKSHGAADSLGFSNALLLAARLARQDLPKRITTQVKLCADLRTNHGLLSDRTKTTA